MVSKTDIVAISDIHMGDNSIACWYNKDYHGPYLKRILEHVIYKKDEIKELIILGDLFDFWTYPPNTQPPTVEEIIHANNNIFGKGGILDKAVTALDGNVSYVVGNHDITVTQEDLDKIPLSNGHRIIKKPDMYKVNKCLFTHGHLFTIFNAPDPKNTVPLGHFVTRLIAYYVQQQRIPAWQIRGFGAPAQRQILFSKAFLPALKFLDKLLVKNKFDRQTISDFVDIWVKVAKFPTNGTFLMADGTTKTINDVKSDYENLFTTWVKNHNIEYVQKSIYTDGTAKSMSWFTQQAALKENVSLTITGHTHWPTSGVNALVDDVNCGFECFAQPDASSSRFSFAEIKDVDTITPTPIVYQIAYDPNTFSYRIYDATNLPKGEITFTSAAADYSCYVRIKNDSPHNLFLTQKINPNGKWVVEPSQIIQSGELSGFWLQDKSGVHGADGAVIYLSDDKKIITLKFDCPTGFYNNSVIVGGQDITYKTKVGNGSWKSNSVDKSGHPLSVIFRIK